MQNSQDNIPALNGVTKRYGAVTALKDVSLDRPSRFSVTRALQ